MSMPRLPRLTAALLVVALLAAIAGATYALFFNPEMAFWKAAAERKLAWVEAMRRKHGHVIGVIGGSTTTFGIDAEMLHRDFGLPVANLGLHAGMGAEVCTGFGFAALQRGDTLIVSLEPSMLVEESRPTPLGTRLAWVLGRPELLAWDHPPSLRSRLSEATQMQPGGYHVVTMLGKIALGQPLYRYSMEGARPGGLQVTGERRPFTNSMDLTVDPRPPTLSKSGRSLLERIKNEAARRGMLVAYVMPWAFWPADSADRRRAANSKLLDQIAEILPVWREPKMGVHDVLPDFADSVQHLTAKAAEKRSRVLAETLRSEAATLPSSAEIPLP